MTSMSSNNTIKLHGNMLQRKHKPRVPMKNVVSGGTEETGFERNINDPTQFEPAPPEIGPKEASSS